MGISISSELYEKIERNRREDRLCSGPTSSRVGCSIPATVSVVTDSWVYQIGEGKCERREQKMCSRHARQVPVGYCGVNFEVVDKVSLPRR